MTVKIIIGDNRQTLKGLPDESIQCIVTSPPYWGLRDYGTAVWVGGDPECDHVSHQIRTGMGMAALGEKYRGGGHKQGQVDEIQFADVCEKCGAVREDAQLGLEPLHDCLAWARCDEPCGRCYVCNLRALAKELHRVLRDDGTFWLNLGDSYAGNGGQYGDKLSTLDGRKQHGSQGAVRFTKNVLKPKNLVGIPWRVALALQADGWWLRSDIVWHKPNGLPESVTDRPTKGHEYIFLLSKSKQYFYDHEAIKTPMKMTTVERAAGGTWRNNEDRPDVGFPGQPNRNKAAINRDIRDKVLDGDIPTVNRRTVWEISTKPFSGAHFAVFPPDLVELMIKAGSSEHGRCPTCGAPWERVIVKGEPEATKENPNEVRPYTADGFWKTNGASDTTTLHKTRTIETVYWQPTCGCPEHEPVACVILDPFGGAGTSGLVADRLGRDAILLELNEEYGRMAANRIKADAGMFADVTLVMEDKANE